MLVAARTSVLGIVVAVLVLIAENVGAVAYLAHVESEAVAASEVAGSRAHLARIKAQVEEAKRQMGGVHRRLDELGLHDGCRP